MSEFSETPSNVNQNQSNPFKTIADKFRPNREHQAKPENQEQISALTAYIDEEIRKIKNEDYKRAIQHFRTPLPPEQTGIRFSDEAQSLMVWSDIPPEETARYTDMIAQRSKYKPSSRTVSPSMVYGMPKADGQLATIPQELYKETSLIHAEEWTHALQHLRGDPLTNYAKIEEGAKKYLEDRGVPLTQNFLERSLRKEKMP